VKSAVDCSTIEQAVVLYGYSAEFVGKTVAVTGIAG